VKRNRGGSLAAPNLPMTLHTERPTRSGLRKVEAADLVVGLICADRDGNRVRIDSVDHAAGKLSYHFLNDELRVQEGVQEPLIAEFLAQAWRIETARN
jgi:hypothetical protein